MKTYNWNELTSVEEKIVVNNLLSRALNLRKYAPKTYKELNQGYLDNTNRIDTVLKKIGAKTSEDKKEKSFCDTTLRTYSVTITPSWANPLKEPKFPRVGDEDTERHWFEVKFILNTCGYGNGIGLYWVRTDIVKSRALEMLKEGFKTDKISMLEVSA